MYKKVSIWCAAIIAMVSVSGCIQMEHEIQIQTNGAAVYRLHYAISEQAITQFHAAFKLRNDLAAAAGEIAQKQPDDIIMTFLNPSTTAIRAHLNQWSEFGVTIREINQKTRSLWRDFSIVIDIEDIGQLQNIPLFNKYGFSIHLNEEGHYVLDRQALAKTAGEIPPNFSSAELDQIRPFLSGFKTEIKIQVPGRIISTTAHRTALQNAIWTFEFDKQPEAMHQLMKQQLYLVFHAPGINLPPLKLAAE